MRWLLYDVAPGEVAGYLVATEPNARVPQQTRQCDAVARGSEAARARGRTMPMIWGGGRARGRTMPMIGGGGRARGRTMPMIGGGGRARGTQGAAGMADQKCRCRTRGRYYGLLNVSTPQRVMLPMRGSTNLLKSFELLTALIRENALILAFGNVRARRLAAPSRVAPRVTVVYQQHIVCHVKRLGSEGVIVVTRFWSVLRPAGS